MPAHGTVVAPGPLAPRHGGPSRHSLREGAANWDALLEMGGNSAILEYPVGVPWSRRPPRAGLSRPVLLPWVRKAPAAPSLPPPRPPAGRPPPYPWPPPPPAGGGAWPARRVSNGPTAGRGGRAGRRAVPAWDFKAPFCAGRQDIDRRSAPGAQAAGRGEAEGARRRPGCGRRRSLLGVSPSLFLHDPQ